MIIKSDIDKTKIFRLSQLLFVCVLGASSQAAFAASCGSGRIIEAKEGMWDTNHFVVKINYDVSSSAHPGTEFQGYIRYKTSLSVERLRGIRAVALLALATGQTVSTYTHSGQCENASELAISTE